MLYPQNVDRLVTIDSVTLFHLVYSEQGVAPGCGETICLPPMAVRIAADLRPSTDGSAVRTSLVAGQLQAASVPKA